MVSPSSLDVVEDAVRREFGAQERRADAADTRAGFLLAFCGLVVSLGANDGWPPLALLARVLAATGGLVALSALASERQPPVGDIALPYSLLKTKPDLARLTLLGRAVDLHHLVGERLAAKEARLRRASRLVVAAVAVALLGVTVEMIARGR